MAMMVVAVRDLEHQENKHNGPKSIKSNHARRKGHRGNAGWPVDDPGEMM